MARYAAPAGRIPCGATDRTRRAAHSGCGTFGRSDRRHGPGSTADPHRTRARPDRAQRLRRAGPTAARPADTMTARTFRRQPGLAWGLPSTPPGVDRVGRHSQPTGDLRQGHVPAEPPATGPARVWPCPAPTGHHHPRTSSPLRRPHTGHDRVEHAESHTTSPGLSRSVAGLTSTFAPGALWRERHAGAARWPQRAFAPEQGLRLGQGARRGSARPRDTGRATTPGTAMPAVR